MGIEICLIKTFLINLLIDRQVGHCIIALEMNQDYADIHICGGVLRITNKFSETIFFYERRSLMVQQCQ